MTSDLPPPGPEELATDDLPPRRARPSRRSADRPEPNYTARRVAVGSAAIALLLVAVVVVSSIIGGDETADPALAEPGWDTIVEVDRLTGAVVALDADGVEIADLDGLGRASALHMRGDRLALVGNDQIVLLALTGDESVIIDVDRASRVFRHPTNRSFTLVVAPDIGGEVTVIDADTGTTTSLGTRAGQTQPLLLPETLRMDRSGTRFAIGDGRNFQTIVVDADPEADPTFFPGVPMGLDRDTVVTSTNAGRTAELGFFAADGTRIGLVPTPRPVAGVLADDRFVYVTEDGRLLGASPTDDEPAEIADLGLPSVDIVAAVLDRTRLLVSSSRRIMVVDLDGRIVHELELSPDDPPLAGITPWTTWRCVPIMRGEAGTIVDLSDGETLDELPAGELMAITPDGCGVHLRTTDADTPTGDLIVTRAGTYTPRDEVRSVVLAADGTAALVVAPDNVVELVTIDDGRRLDLGVRRGLLGFVQR